MRAVVTAVDYHLPDGTLTNAELAEQFPEWSVEKIAAKTGIRQRHIVNGECASDLAVAAANRLFERLGPLTREQVDTVLFCTQTPDYLLPTSACLIQDRLGLSTGTAAFDFNLGCSGYVYGLGIAKGMIETGQSRGALLLNADTYSRLIHARDKSVRTIFGDAGAATLIAAVDADSKPEPIGPFVYGSDGSGGRNLMVASGGMRRPLSADCQSMSDSGTDEPTERNLYMNGPELYAFTLRNIPQLIVRTLEKAELSAEQVDHFVFHQANQFMLESLRDKCGIPPDKFFIGLQDVGNTVSASIPIALRQLDDQRRLLSGQTLMLVGFGVGYSWGATVIRWPG